MEGLGIVLTMLSEDFESEHRIKMMFDIEIKWSLFGSVSDQSHFDPDPDPRIRFVEKRIRILL